MYKIYILNFFYIYCHKLNLINNKKVKKIVVHHVVLEELNMKKIEINKQITLKTLFSFL